MAGFLRRLFGGGEKEPPGGSSDAGETGKVQQPAATGERVRAIASGQLSVPRKGKGTDGDTGPWYIGKTVADIFEIRGVLGWGGMGIVYLAHDNATNRKVAAKVPLGEFVDDQEARKRFAREAVAWTDLIHPNIVHAFDVRDNQTTDYRPAIFMDYCDGGSLADRIYGGSGLSMLDSLDIAIQICWAMEFAHNKGHIHRDLKPGNVLLTSDGKTLVTDFGLIKILEA
jgi:serine/threonine protein kinase